jgi:hypothetical protein
MGVVMSTPAGDGIAERCCVPPTSKQPRRANASKNRYVTMKPRLGREQAWQGTGLVGESLGRKAEYDEVRWIKKPAA